MVFTDENRKVVSLRVFRLLSFTLTNVVLVTRQSPFSKQAPNKNKQQNSSNRPKNEDFEQQIYPSPLYRMRLLREYFSLNLCVILNMNFRPAQR